MSSGKNGELHRQQKRAETTENSPSSDLSFGIAQGVYVIIQLLPFL